MFARFAASALVLSLGLITGSFARAQQSVPTNPTPPAFDNAPSSDGSSDSRPAPPAATPKEKMSRVWSGEPSLVRLARDKFGADLTETDARFFAAVANNDWADLRPSREKTYDAQQLSCWKDAPTLASDRISWLCTDPAAMKLVQSHGVWLRGVRIIGKLHLYRSTVPFSLAFYDCFFSDGMNISHAKLEDLDVRNCFSGTVQARSVQVTENVYFLTACVYGGLDFIDANIGGDFDFSGGIAFHGTKQEDLKEQGIAINLHDAKVSGDIKLADNFRSYGQVRLIGATIGRSLSCGGGKFNGGGQLALDARRSTIESNVVLTSGFLADGGVELRRAKIGGDLDCDGGKFMAPTGVALDADLVNVGGQALLGDGFHAEGETRMVNANVVGDLDCDNGHFLNAEGNAFYLDGTVIGRSLRISADGTSPSDENKELPTGFLARGTLRLWGTQVNQDVLASGAQFEAPAGTALLACNLKVASRVDLTGTKATGTVNLFSADIEHELDLRGSQFDGQQAFGKIAFWANGMQVRGHVYCNQVDGAEPAYRFRSNGVTSFQFATIAKHWDLYGAELINPGGDALDASDCRVGGYINLDTVKIDGRASFSRAKIDGMWVLNKSVEPEKMRLDLRFAHIWVIKDERLSDWPPAGQLQLEGLIYDHFDDDSPLDVNDRLAWLRRQYAPPKGKKDAANVTALQPTGDPSLQRTANSNTSETRATASTDRHAVRPVNYDAPAAMPAPVLAAPAPERPTMPNPITPPPEEADGEGRDLLEAIAQTPGPSSAVPQSAAATQDSRPAAMAPTAAESIVGENAAATDNVTNSATTPADETRRRYVTQPYTQLASVYRAIGQDEQANTVLVARAERLGELAPPFSAHGLWYGYLGQLIGYGYEPFRAIKIGLVIIGLGALVFAIGARRNLMAETKLAEQVLSNETQPGLVSPSYPRFNAIVYSLDVFLPFVELNQVCYWIPGEKPGSGKKSRNCLMHIGPYSLKWSSVLHGYLWFQTLAGWTLCTLLAAAVTGIVQS
jgi:hypothetical protein